MLLDNIAFMYPTSKTHKLGLSMNGNIDTVYFELELCRTMMAFKVLCRISVVVSNGVFPDNAMVLEMFGN